MRPDVDLLEPALHASGRAHEVYASLRQHEPISWRGAYWAVTRHRDVVEVASDWRRFSSARGTGPRAIDADPPLRSIHISDPPIHTEMRRIVEASYGHGWLRALAEPIREEARARIAAWAEMGTVDAVATLADPLAFGVLERLLGQPAPELLPILHRFARYDDPRYRQAGETPEQCFRDAERLVWDFLRDLVAERAARPRDDATSRLLASGALEDRDLMFALRFIVQTTYQTTALAIAGGVATLAAEQAQLRALPREATPRAADELLRWTSPVIRFARHVTHDTTLAGVPLRAGERVLMFFASANRDERVFAAPDRIDLLRAPNPHVAFGAGPHACLGAALARLQLCAVIDALRDLDFELVARPRAFESSVNAGFDRVLVRVDVARAPGSGRSQ
ncbi:MAG TPA: cytochrome P450 [Kofleriaceae bacterium]|nr:cytochrome P450 [Kofleriaceae bacterium]